MASIIVTITLSSPTWLLWHGPCSLVLTGPRHRTHVVPAHLILVPAVSSPEEAPGRPPSPARHPHGGPLCPLWDSHSPAGTQLQPFCPRHAASAGRPVTGARGWVQSLRTLHFGSIYLALCASRFLFLNQRQCFWKGCSEHKTRRDIAAVCWITGVFRMPVGRYLLPTHFPTWTSLQPGRQGSSQVKTRSFGGEVAGSRPPSYSGTELNLESRTSDFPSYVLSTVNLQGYCCFI